MDRRVVETWRDPVVNRLLLVFLVLSAVTMPFITLQIGSVALHVVAWTQVGTLLVGWLLRRRLHIRWRVGLLIANCWMALIGGLVLTGPLIGVGLAGAMAVLFGGLFLGRRAGWAALGLVGASTAVVGVLMVSGFVAAPSTSIMDMTRPGAWAREVGAFVLFTGLLVFTTDHIFRRIGGALSDSEQALEALKAEQQERERAQAALAKAERAMEELRRVEALGRLAGAVAHDFNNAMMVLISGLEVLRDGPVGEQEHELLDDMRHAADGASDLTAQLLTYGRKSVLRRQHLDLTVVLNDARRALRRLFPTDIEIEVEIEGQPWVVGDRAQLDQALLNLSLNARDAMAGGGCLRLLAREEGADVVIEVKDTGHGMDEQTRARIFEPFFTTKEIGKGTGLGMSIAFTAVQAMNGRLDVISAPGHGTTMHVALPRVAPPEAQQAQVSAPVHSCASGTILLAEDEPAVRTSMVRSLERAGFEVVAVDSVPSGMQALDARGGSLHLLCTDGLMPGGPCEALIARFQEVCPSRPVLVCSGYLPSDGVRAMVEQGEVSFLSKPVTGSELVARISALMTQNQEALEGVGQV